MVDEIMDAAVAIVSGYAHCAFAKSLHIMIPFFGVLIVPVYKLVTVWSIICQKGCKTDWYLYRTYCTCILYEVLEN
jgi:nitrate reductase gamma subunit